MAEAKITDTFIMTRNPTAERTLKWTVENFSEIAGILKSPEFFLLPELKFYFTLRLRNSQLCISFTRVSDTRKPVKVKHYISLHNSEGKEYRTDFCEHTYVKDDYICKCTTYLLKDNVANMLPLKDDILIVQCRFFICGHNLNSVVSSCLPPTGNTSDDLINDFRKLLIDSLFADVVIVVGQQSISAHKALLCARSPTFSKLLETHAREKHGNCIAIQDVEFDVFKKLLEYLYTGQVRKLTFDEAKALYCAAKKYADNGLQKLCLTVLHSEITFQRAFEVLQLAAEFKDEALKKLCKDFFCKNWMSIKETNEWKEVVKENQSLALEISNSVSSF